MEKKFKETTIPEDISKVLAKQQFLVGSANVYMLPAVLFHATSRAIGAMKNTSIPKAIVFRGIDNSFLAAAKVEYITNEDDPTNPAAGRWDYSWTFYEEDVAGCDIVNANSNNIIVSFFESSGSKLYNIRFPSADACVLFMVTSLEFIKNWIRENASESDPAIITLDGYFKATGVVVDGKIEMGIVPDGEMKVLIKDDAAIQER